MARVLSVTSSRINASARRISRECQRVSLWIASHTLPATVFPKGVTINLPENAFACYVVFDGRDGHSFPIDMNGNEVRTWPHSGFPSEIIDPAVNGGRKGHVFLQKENDEFEN